MCWKTQFGMLSVQRTAAKDIRVKKVFVRYPEGDPRCGLYSFFNRSFRWRIGQIYKEHLYKPLRVSLPLLNRKEYIWRVFRGFHSAKEIKVEWNQDKGIGYLFIGKNEISRYDIRDKPFLENNVVIHECVIPKGSKYYLNVWGNYVSDQLLILPNK